MRRIEVARAHLHRAGGPIPRSSNARASWERRDTILVALHDGEGRVGLGEAAPLPGMSSDSIEDVEAELRAWRFAGAVEGHAEGCDRFAGDLQGAVVCPSARFALELAMLDLVGQTTGCPAWQLLLPPSPAVEVAVSALLGDASAPGAIDRARHFVGQGARTLKLKLGAHAIACDVAAVTALRGVLGQAIALIGDANGAWSKEMARSALEMLAPLAFAYVEQPVPSDALDDLGPTAIPVWADESLILESTRARALASPHVAGVVLKPTMLGGLRACADVAQRAHRSGKGVVVTHSLEGPVGLGGCATLAISLGNIAKRAGIWPHDALAAFPAVALPGDAAGTLTAHGLPGLGFAEEQRRRLLALPRIDDDR